LGNLCDFPFDFIQERKKQMRKLIAQTVLAAAFGGAIVSATPANAQSFSINIGFPGVGFSYNSGGYCDRWGCPDSFWNYPIYYCPVYYGGRWYSGPVYYRYYRGTYLYWIHGNWRRDYWNGPRPRGACVDRYGPPLDLDFYIWNGFNVRDDWRYGWDRNRNEWWNHRQQWDRTNRGDTSWRSWLPQQQQGYDWNRERNWNTNREWTRPDWNRSDWQRKHNINPGANVTPTQPMNQPGGYVPPITKPAPFTPPPQMDPSVTPPTTNVPPSNTGGRFHDHFKGGQGNGAPPGVTTIPAPQTSPAVTPPVTNNPVPGTTGHNRDHFKGGRGALGTGGSMGGTTTPAPQSTPALTAPTATNPPTDLRGRMHDHTKSGQGAMGPSGAQGGIVTPTTPMTAPVNTQPATTNAPSDQGGDRHKHKRGQDNQGTGSNSPQ
jgi:hypothetical protein